MLNPRTHSRDFPDSYYAATPHYPQRYPALEEHLDVDVCVVGGGFSGTNTAIELAQRGYSVVVLEAQLIGWGASGRNGGQLIRGIGHGLDQFKNTIGQEGVDAINQMGLEAVEIVRNRVKEHQIHCDLQMGYCNLANKPRHLKVFEEDKAWLDSIDYPYKTQLVTRDDMHSVIGSNRFYGGLIDKGSGHVHPLNLITGEAQAASTLGVKIFERSQVNDIVEGDSCLVKTDRGSVLANTVVLCANAYGASLHPTLSGQVLPCGSYIIATEPLGDELANRVLPQNMAVCDQRVAVNYFRLSADKRLLFGGRCSYSGRDVEDIVGAIRPDMLKIFPYLDKVKIDYHWGGMLGIGANRLPQIGRLRPNVYYAQAYAGHGVNATHMAAKLIAECIHNESQRIEVFEKVKHIRFPGGQYFRSPILALGMMYHRLLDLF